MFVQLLGVRGRLSELVTALDPDAVTGAAARELWAEFDRVERLAAAAKTLLARRVADTHDGERTATRSPAEDLARRGGTSTGAAKDAVDTSRRLPDLPGVEGALRRGELSAAQAALISAAAHADPTAADRLLDLARRASLTELREECARVRAAADPDPDATNRRLHQQRRLRRWTDAEGGWNLAARGTVQQGAAFNAILDPIIDQIFRATRADGRRDTHEAYAFDALMTMADRVAEHPPATHPATHPDAHPDADAAHHANAAAHPQPTGNDDHDHDDHDAVGRPAAAPAADPQPTDGGDGDDHDAAGGGDGRDGADRDPGAGCGRAAGAGADRPARAAAAAPAAGRVPSRQPVNPRYLALLRVDVAALRRGRVAGDELCEITGVGPVPVSVARGLLGEAIVKLVITRGVAVANVTHLGRGPTAAQRAALLWTNPTCSVQGCAGTRIEWDHREPWALTRHTRLDELDPLCSFHHDLTRHGHALVPGTGKRALVAPNDPRHPRHHTARADPRAGPTT